MPGSMQTRSPTLRCVTSCADLDDRPGRLVAEHHRRVDDERPDPAVRVVVHVGAADADGVELDLHLARADRRAAGRCRGGDSSCWRSRTSARMGHSV